MRLRLISLFVLLYHISFANDTLDYVHVEKWSYTYYMQNDLKNINKLGKAAIDKQIDYYFLRMRIGIVNYNHKNYINASTHFKKALTFYSSDTLALEYLYFSYLYSNNTSEAMKIAKKMPIEKQQQLKTVIPKFIESINLQGAYQLNTTYDKQITETQVFTAFPFKRDINKNLQYYNVSLKHQITPNLSFVQAYTSINKLNSLKPFTANNIFYDGFTNQKQYYISGQYLFKNTISIGAGMHLLKLSNDWVAFDDILNKISINKIDTAAHLYFYSLGFQRNYFKLIFFNGFSNFNKKKQTQFSLTGYTFPMGNTNLYTETNISYQPDTSGYLIKQMLGFKIPHMPCWFEVFYSTNTLSNYSDANGYVLYNTTDQTIMKTGLGIIVPLFKNKITVSLNWNYETRKAPEPYDNLLNKITIPTASFIKSTHQTIIGGLTWKL